MKQVDVWDAAGDHITSVSGEVLLDPEEGTLIVVNHEVDFKITHNWNNILMFSETAKENTDA